MRRPLDAGAELGRQRVAGGLHAAEPGVAAARRDLQRIEHRGVGRRVEIAHVGVPHRLAGAQGADRIAVGVEHVGHDIDVGIARRADAAALLVGRRIELAEAPAERQQVVVAERLAAQQDHRMLGARRARSPANSASLSRREIDAGNLRAHRRGHGADRHAMSFPPFSAAMIGRASGRDQAPSTAPASSTSLAATAGASGPAKPGRSARTRA